MGSGYEAMGEGEATPHGEETGWCAQGRRRGHSARRRGRRATLVGEGGAPHLTLRRGRAAVLRSWERESLR